MALGELHIVHESTLGRWAHVRCFVSDLLRVQMVHMGMSGNSLIISESFLQLMVAGF